MGSLRLETCRSQHAPLGTSRLSIAGRSYLSVLWQPDGLAPVFGEASPLQGYGSDDLVQAERELRSLTDASLEGAARRVAEAFDESATDLLERGNAALDEVAAWSQELCSPSARFCGQMLVLGAAARHRGVPLWRLITSECVAPALPTSTVLDPLSDELLTTFETAYERGIRTFKIKCGRHAERERDVVLRVLPASGVRLRLDPNGAWTPIEAERFLSDLPTESLEWVEDPTSDPTQWTRLRERTGVPFALDEPLGSGMTKKEAQELRPDVIVLKPMAIGGITACVEWARLAHTFGGRVCVSHLFDGRAAMNACIHLAFALQSADRAPGLGMHDALAADVSGAPGPDGLFVDLLRAPALSDSKS